MTSPPGPRRVRELLALATGWLEEREVEGARLDAELLLAHALSCRRLDLYLDHDRPLEEPELERFRGLLRRRGEREPVAYLVGRRGFYGLDVLVDPGVLVPRPETETLVEVALGEVDRLGGEVRFADVGTGSGCVALVLTRERAGARGLATDTSPAALAVARRNLAETGLGERVALLRADLLGPLGPGSVDLVVSNPPYVTPDEVGLLAPEVARHEPTGALFDAEGLPLTRRLAAEAFAALRPGGALAVETGYRKADLVASILTGAGFAEVGRTADQGGVERVVHGRKPGGGSGC